MGLCQGRERARVEILARDLEDLKRKNASYLDRLTDFENNLGEQFNQINQNLLALRWAPVQDVNSEPCAKTKSTSTSHTDPSYDLPHHCKPHHKPHPDVSVHSRMHPNTHPNSNQSAFNTNPNTHPNKENHLHAERRRAGPSQLEISTQLPHWTQTKPSTSNKYITHPNVKPVSKYNSNRKPYASTPQAAHKRPTSGVLPNKRQNNNGSHHDSGLANPLIPPESSGYHIHQFHQGYPPMHANVGEKGEGEWVSKFGRSGFWSGSSNRGPSLTDEGEGEDGMQHGIEHWCPGGNMMRTSDSKSSSEEHPSNERKASVNNATHPNTTYKGGTLRFSTTKAPDQTPDLRTLTPISRSLETLSFAGIKGRHGMMWQDLREVIGKFKLDRFGHANHRISESEEELMYFMPNSNDSMSSEFEDNVSKTVHSFERQNDSYDDDYDDDPELSRAGEGGRRKKCQPHFEDEDDEVYSDNGDESFDDIKGPNLDLSSDESNLKSRTQTCTPSRSGRPSAQICGTGSRVNDRMLPNEVKNYIKKNGSNSNSNSNSTSTDKGMPAYNLDGTRVRSHCLTAPPKSLYRLVAKAPGISPNTEACTNIPVTTIAKTSKSTKYCTPPNTSNYDSAIRSTGGSIDSQQSWSLAEGGVYSDWKNSTGGGKNWVSKNEQGVWGLGDEQDSQDGDNDNDHDDELSDVDSAMEAILANMPPPPLQAPPRPLPESPTPSLDSKAPDQSPGQSPRSPFQLRNPNLRLTGKDASVTSGPKDTPLGSWKPRAPPPPPDHSQVKDMSKLTTSSS